VAAKVANVGVPLLLKNLVDALDLKPGDARGAAGGADRACCWPMAALRLSHLALHRTARAGLRQGHRAHGAQHQRWQVFRHLHALSLRFHLERQTGGMTRDIERGTRAVHSLISYSLYSIVPTLVEVTLVLTLLAVKFDGWFAWITLTALVVYIELHDHGHRVAHAVPPRR
jgi:ABC-type multidrug transport system fused ATPase/permease subunit